MVPYASRFRAIFVKNGQKGSTPEPRRLFGLKNFKAQKGRRRRGVLTDPSASTAFWGLKFLKIFGQKVLSALSKICEKFLRNFRKLGQAGLPFSHDRPKDRSILWSVVRERQTC